MYASYAIYSELRDKMSLSDYEVSKQTGIPCSTFSDWKSGRSKPKLEKLVKIAKCLGVAIEDLLTEERRVHEG